MKQTLKCNTEQVHPEVRVRGDLKSGEKKSCQGRVDPWQEMNLSRRNTGLGGLATTQPDKAKKASAKEQYGTRQRGGGEGDVVYVVSPEKYDNMLKLIEI